MLCDIVYKHEIINTNEIIQLNASSSLVTAVQIFDILYAYPYLSTFSFPSPDSHSSSTSAFIFTSTVNPFLVPYFYPYLARSLPNARPRRRE